MHATVTWIKKFLWAPKPGWLLSDAYWWLRERTNHRCLFCASLNPIFAYNRRCTNPAASYVSGWTCFTWSRCVCIWLSDISSASHVIPLSVLETRASERAGECVNVSLREVWMWGATCNARLLCLVVSSLCVCLLLFTRVHVQTRTDTHANFTSLQPFLPRAFISNSFPSISTINHSSLSTNAAITPKDDERERCIQK